MTPPKKTHGIFLKCSNSYQILVAFCSRCSEPETNTSSNSDRIIWASTYLQSPEGMTEKDGLEELRPFMCNKTCDDQVSDGFNDFVFTCSPLKFEVSWNPI